MSLGFKSTFVLGRTWRLDLCTCAWLSNCLLNLASRACGPSGVTVLGSKCSGLLCTRGEPINRSSVYKRHHSTVFDFKILESSQNEKTSAYQLCFFHDDHSVQICPRETCREPAAKVLDIELPMTGELDDARKTLRDSNGRLVFGAMALRSSPEMFRGFIWLFVSRHVSTIPNSQHAGDRERERESTCWHVPQLHINQKEPNNAVS